MPDFIQPFYADYKGIKAAPGGLAPADGTRTKNFTTTAVSGPEFFLPLQHERISAVRIASDTGIVAWADLSTNTWYFTDTAGAGTVLPSPQPDPIVQYDFATGIPAFVISDPSPLDAALGVFASLSVEVQLASTVYSQGTPSPAVFSSFQENVASYSADLQAQLVRLDRDLRARGSQVITPAGFVINGCAAAYVGPSGLTFVDPVDIGGGPGQLPADPANLTAQHLRNHPSVFVRGTDSLRSVGSLAGASSDFEFQPVVADGIPLTFENPDGDTVVNAEIFSIPQPPLFTRWTVVLDGVVYTGWFEVPNGNPNGLTRPRDLYQAIFGRSLSRDGNDPTFIWAPDNANSQMVRTQLVRDWEHLVYARIDGYIGENGPIVPEQVYTLEQGGGPPPD